MRPASGWLVASARQLKNLTLQRNRNIETGVNLVNQQGGRLNFYVLDSVLQRHASVADAECVTALQLFKNFLDMASNLERINDKKQGKKLIPSPALEEAAKELQKIADQISPKKTWHSDATGAKPGQ